MATGGVAGVYRSYGQAVGDLWNRVLRGVGVTVESTAASVENVRLLRSGQVELALVQSDVAHYAWSGTEPFREGTRELGGVAALYPELVQWVVSPGTGSLADLKGKKIAVGPQGSGSELNARQILEANGIAYRDLGKALFLSDAEATAFYIDGQLDGFLATGGVPLPAISEAAASRGIGLLAIDGEAARRVADSYRFFVPARVPAGVYRGLTAEVPTLAVQAMMMARLDLDADLVYWLTRTLMERQPELARAHPKGAELSLDRAARGLSVPLHPGAERYYREVGAVQ